MSKDNKKNPIVVAGKRNCRSNSVLERSNKSVIVIDKQPNGLVYASSRDPKPNKLRVKNKGQNRNTTYPVQCSSSSCELLKTVHFLVEQHTKQCNEIMLAKKQLMEMQNKYINALEVSYLRNEKYIKSKETMQAKISVLQSEIGRIKSDMFVDDLIDLEGGSAENEVHNGFDHHSNNLDKESNSCLLLNIMLPGVTIASDNERSDSVELNEKINVDLNNSSRDVSAETNIENIGSFQWTPLE